MNDLTVNDRAETAALSGRIPTEVRNRKMAAGILPKAGEKYGPCVGDCLHTDCMTTRAMAEAACRICLETIGYGVSFYDESKGGEMGSQRSDNLVHAVCAEDEVDAGFALKREAAR